MTNSRPGRDLLRGFLRKNKLTQDQAATAMHTTKATVSTWCNGQTQPRAEWRTVIERWTCGLVPADAWMSADDRALVRKVKPFEGKP